MAELLITGIEPVKRTKGWFELVTRGKPPFYIDKETIYRNSIRVGDIISEPKWKKIKGEADLAWLKFKGMQILSRRMLSERDLRRKLAAERKPQAITDEAMADLKRYGFYDDSQFAAAFIRSQMSRGVKSKIYLKKKLWEKGISDDVASEVLSSELAEYDELTAVVQLAQKKYKTLRNLPKDKARSRLINFLRGRGFSWDIIRQAIDQAGGGEREEY